MRNPLPWIFSALFGSSLAFAAVSGNAVAERGEQVYRVTCATGYCHGVNGTMAGAPRLVARGFDTAFIRSVISDGVKNSSMPGFAQTLPREDLIAVMTYVAALNDIRDPVFLPAGGLGVAAPAERQVLSNAAERGRALFYDATKGVQRCSTCHELEGLGIPVAAPIVAVPASITALRGLQTPQVQRITVNGDSMPGLMIANGVSGTLYYDLTVAPPVLRTLPAGTPVVQSAESAWSHDNFLQAYDDEELQAVLDYLTELRP